MMMMSDRFLPLRDANDFECDNGCDLDEVYEKLETTLECLEHVIHKLDEVAEELRDRKEKES